MREAIVCPAVLFGRHLHLQQCVEHLPVQQFIPQLSVEALHVSVLPRRPGLDIQGAGSRSPAPFPDCPGHELRAVIRADLLRNFLGCH